jgi:hypothetical protein
VLAPDPVATTMSSRCEVATVPPICPPSREAMSFASFRQRVQGDRAQELPRNFQPSSLSQRSGETRHTVIGRDADCNEDPIGGQGGQETLCQPDQQQAQDTVYRNPVDKVSEGSICQPSRLTNVAPRAESSWGTCALNEIPVSFSEISQSLCATCFSIAWRGICASVG